MTLVSERARGLAEVLVDPDVDPDALHLHISEIGPGTAAHPPHTHAGVEAFYILEGHGTLAVGEKQYALGPNQAAVLEATKHHGLTNTGDTPLRYIVIIRK